VSAHARTQAHAPVIDDDLFPPAFLRLLAVIPAAVQRLRACSSEGRRVAPGHGGRFLFRGHRAYRPGDDLRRVDWRVAARLDRLLVRQFDAERDLLTEVWVDGSASMAPYGGRVKSARAAALACAVGVAAAGRTRLGVVREGGARVLLEASHPGHLTAILRALTAEVPAGRADLAEALPRLVRRLPRAARFLWISDLLSRTDAGVLHAFSGRGLRGGVLHLRVPEVTAPEPTGRTSFRDVETGEVRSVLLDAAAAGRVAERAKAHADRWAHHANAVGLRYLPFAPSTSDEALLRRIVEDVP
jgi:uncharacterized protein (DUF58 family)